MQKRILALLLVLALGCSLLATAAFAEENTEELAPLEETQESGETPAEETLPALVDTTGAEAGSAAEKGGTTVGAENAQLTVPQPDQVGHLSYANLESRARENNITIKMLDASIASLDVMDFEKMQDDLRDGLNAIAQNQYMLISMGQSDSYAYASLESSYSSLRETFDDLKDGKIQNNAAAAIRQLENAEDQLVMGAETL